MMELQQKLDMPKPTDNLFFHATNIAQVYTEDLQKILETFLGRLILVENIKSVECKIVAFNSKSSLCSCPCGLNPPQACTGSSDAWLIRLGKF